MKLLADNLTLPGADGVPITIAPPPGIPSGGIDVIRLITGNAINLLFAFGVIFALFYLLSGALQWTTSGGDKQKIAAARNRLIYSVIGLVIIVFSIFIVNFVLFILRQKPI